MAETVTEQRNSKLETVLSSVLDSGIRALADLVGQEVKGCVGQLTSVDPNQLVGQLEGQHAVVCGALDRDYQGQTFRLLIPAREATTLSGYVMMAPEETIEGRRQTGTLEGEELETFAEVANVLCSGFDAVLQEIADGDILLRAQESSLVQPGADASELFGDHELVGYSFGFSVGGHPESKGWLLLEPSTANRLIGAEAEGALQGHGARRVGVQAGRMQTGGTQTGVVQAVEEEEIPAAPTRGRLTTYLADPGVLPELRKSCRRVGLELDQRARGEVPNPAEHREGSILIDVPSGDTRRFDWCHRLKQHSESVRVALVIHHPSRSQVLKAFLAGADAIMAWPISEREMSPKLAALLPPSEE